ncbi:hypothetical protein [Paenibacillus sp. OSY-SE]|uniref:hypothetical protein n=1 Tax=Paenibacillus sp. OSY-SE TaxID=1196323 RepID=UPI000312E0B3|nr:hypothetical protein [Paenibacillus sp. OSY-SE]
MTGARIVDAIGGGSLVVDTERAAQVLVRYTSMESVKFSFACRLLQALAKGEDIPVPSADDWPKRWHYPCIQPIAPVLFYLYHDGFNELAAYAVRACSRPFQARTKNCWRKMGLRQARSCPTGNIGN